MGSEMGGGASVGVPDSALAACRFHHTTSDPRASKKCQPRSRGAPRVARKNRSLLPAPKAHMRSSKGAHASGGAAAALLPRPYPRPKSLYVASSVV